MGKTSRGIFLRLEGDRIVFLSGESYRGPLTLNLGGPAHGLDSCQVGESVQVDGGRLRFAGCGVELDYNRATGWEAPPLPAAALPPQERSARLLAVARLVLSDRPGSGLSGLLPGLLGLPGLPAGKRFPVDLDCLQAALSGGLWAPALAAALPFLGLGSGLTPSGDDLLLGLLLALTRWGPPPGLRFDTASFAKGLLSEAPQRTTALSAELLACAAEGQADERLVAALDALLAGTASPDSCAAGLLSWGHSSGCDALVGMALFMGLVHD